MVNERKADSKLEKDLCLERTDKNKQRHIDIVRKTQK